MALSLAHPHYIYTSCYNLAALPHNSSIRLEKKFDIYSMLILRYGLHSSSETPGKTREVQTFACTPLKK